MSWNLMEYGPLRTYRDPIAGGLRFVNPTPNTRLFDDGTLTINHALERMLRNGPAPFSYKETAICALIGRASAEVLDINAARYKCDEVPVNYLVFNRREYDEVIKAS